MPAFAGISEIRDTEVESVLYKLINPVATTSGLGDGRLKIHILNSSDFNAFVSTGEDVYLYTGLINTIKKPDELRAVIAHEIGHMQGGHYHILQNRMEKEMAGMVAMQVLGVAMMVAGGGSGANLGAGLMLGSQSISNQNMLSFSRDEERLADDAALNTMKKLKISYQSLIDVLTSSRDSNLMSENRMNAYNIGHPLVEERIRNIKLWADKNKYQSQNLSEKDNLNYARIRAKLAGYLLNDYSVQFMYPDSDKSIEACYAKSIMLMRNKSYDKALESASYLIAEYPDDPYFHELLGDIHYQMGDFSESISEYEKSIAELPKSVSPAQIQQSLALALIAKGGDENVNKAREYAKKILIYDKNAIMAYWILAKIYENQNNYGVHYYYMAEYYNLAADKKRAKKFAQKALENLDKNSPEYLKSRDLINLKNK